MKRLLLLGLVAAGCGGDPVNAEGTWSVSGTYRDNDCNLDNWTPGNTFQNVSLAIQQNGESVLGQITGGLSELFLGALLGGGDHSFSGSVEDDSVTMTEEGTRAFPPEGNCTYTYNARITLDINGDSFAGRITYTRATNGNSDCAALECSNYQELSGSRPPQ